MHRRLAINLDYRLSIRERERDEEETSFPLLVAGREASGRAVLLAGRLCVAARLASRSACGRRCIKIVALARFLFSAGSRRRSNSHLHFHSLVVVGRTSSGAPKEARERHTSEQTNERTNERTDRRTANKQWLGGAQQQLEAALICMHLVVRGRISPSALRRRRLTASYSASELRRALVDRLRNQAELIPSSRRAAPQR